MNNYNKENKVLSIGGYKEKVEKKVKWIKEFEEGPQAIAGCTCGQHTDPNQFLREKQVTKHYLKDRQRYVKGLSGQDPMAIYMETFNGLMGDWPLVKLNMATDLAMMTYLSNHFNKGMAFYKAHIVSQEELTDTARLVAKELIIGYEGYKEHMVKILINSYIKSKLRFNRENVDFAWKKDDNTTSEDSLDTPISNTEGYISFMEEHFQKADIEISTHALSIAAQNLNKQITQMLNYNHIPSQEVHRLGMQMKESLDIVKQVIAKNRQRDSSSLKH